VEADCVLLEGHHVADPDRVQAYIRSYALLLNAEFQAYCRDLHDECAKKVADSVSPPAVQALFRSQSIYGRKLDVGNPTLSNLCSDFNRFQFDLSPKLTTADPGHEARIRRLGGLHAWRNAIAHHDYDPAKLGAGTRLTIAQVRDWQTDCDAFAVLLDRVVRAELEQVTGLSLWPP
jgi:hypothetical protein